MCINLGYGGSVLPQIRPTALDVGQQQQDRVVCREEPNKLDEKYILLSVSDTLQTATSIVNGRVMVAHCEAKVRKFFKLRG